ncbi:MAG: DUF4124 domain-containing protein [Leptothrix sp. (in: b-proteobacteria)]
MFKNFTWAMVVAVFMAPLSLEAATSVFKCTINGSVSYQNDPCPSGSPRKLPTVDQLNAERQKAPPQVGDRGEVPLAVSGSCQVSRLEPERRLWCARTERGGQCQLVQVRWSRVLLPNDTNLNKFLDLKRAERGRGQSSRSG